ncbi:hypothetical protein D9M69_576160 [compost metagenome]
MNLRSEPPRTSFNSSATMIGTGRKNTIFIAEMISVLASTCQNTGEENSTWKCLIPTQMLGGTIRTCSKAMRASQIGR